MMMMMMMMMMTMTTTMGVLGLVSRVTDVAKEVYS
jgi:hypothetical protein